MMPVAHGEGCMSREEGTARMYDAVLAETVTITADPTGALTEPADPKRTRTVSCAG